MSKKKITSVGFELASEDIKYKEFDSDESLLDWDIVLFKPSIDEFISYAETYQGKPSLSDSSSFRLKERTEHWRREIKDSMNNGKTVIVFLSDLEEIFIDTGERTYSGTGRNQKTTIMVTNYDNYKCIPFKLQPVKTKGSAMKLCPKRGEILASYWKEFESYSHYKVVLNSDNIPSSILTKSGDKPVGAIYKSKESYGALILLPDIDFYDKSFLKVSEEYDWNKEAFSFASRLLKSILAIDKSLKNIGETTPEPSWVKNSKYELSEEKILKSNLLKLEDRLEQVLAQKETLLEELKNTGKLRNLLFEKGKLLEYAIIAALNILGFKTSQYRDGESQFDVVFESDEGRLIGEAEGKDNRPINIDKLRQLEMNIYEDLERDEIDEPAKAVLFGNGYRLSKIDERSDPFTAKCMSSALRTSTALVNTPDLFNVCQYLADKRDKRFATKCRKAILKGVGLVSFPEPPVTDSITTVESNKKKT